MDYLRRLMQNLTGPNILNELTQQSLITQVIQNSSGGVGNVKLSVYSDYNWSDSSTPFGGTFQGSLYVPAIAHASLDQALQIGESDFSRTNNTMAVRYEAKVVPKYSEDYTFEVNHDDGCRLYVGGSIAIDNWAGGSGTDDSSPISLTANIPVPIKLEVCNSAGGTMTAILKWSSTSETGGTQLLITPNSFVRST